MRRHAGVIDQHVDPAEGFDCGIDERDAIGLHADIAALNEHLCATRSASLRDSLELVDAACREHERRVGFATRRPLPRHLRADAVGCTGDHDHSHGSSVQKVTADDCSGIGLDRART